MLPWHTWHSTSVEMFNSIIKGIDTITTGLIGLALSNAMYHLGDAILEDVLKYNRNIGNPLPAGAVGATRIVVYVSAASVAISSLSNILTAFNSK